VAVIDPVAISPAEALARELQLAGEVDLEPVLEDEHLEDLSDEPRWHRVGAVADADRAPRAHAGLLLRELR
jgi:hypothetical protein